MQRIKSLWDDFIERLRFTFSNSHSQTVVLDVEVTSDSPAKSADDNKLASSRHRLFVRISDKCIEIDGQRTLPYRGLLTEDNMTAVLNNHPKLEEVTQLVVTHHEYLSSLPVSIGKLMNLTILDLSANHLQDLPWSVVYLTRLKILNLSHNRFYTVPPIIGHLSNLEKLLLNDNCLEYLPTSILQLENLQVLQVSGNEWLVAPPLDVCSRGLDAVFKNLKTRCQRRNLWSGNTQFYEPPDCDTNTQDYRNTVNSLLEICVASVLQYHIDFFSQPFVPPPLKRHLYDSEAAKKAEVRVSKCSKCHNFFSSEAYFDGHDC